MSPAYVPHPAAPRQGARTFDDFAQQVDGDLDLVEGALLIASDFDPDQTRSSRARQLLDELAKPLLHGALGNRPIDEQATALRVELAETGGFTGNEDDYYDPRNSFLPDVLERRRGIPISLAVVYIDVARRAGIRARGVGFPGHFLLRLDRERDDETPVLLDPFYGGRVVTRTILGELLAKTGAPAEEIPPALLAPISTRLLLQRMLMNLRNVFLHRGEFGKALLVVNRVLSLSPKLTEAIFDRGLIAERAGIHGCARESFEEYLAAAPEGVNRSTAEERLLLLKGRKSTAN